MAKKPRERQKTDAGRYRQVGNGKLDAPAAKPARDPRRSERATRPADVDELRGRLERERDAAIARLRAVRVSPELEENAPPRGNESTLEEGDAAQASERRDVSFTTRERLARRINDLTAALERLHRGEYGRCRVCGRDIEPVRLAAIPEASTCLPCQSQIERTGGTPERAA